MIIEDEWGRDDCEKHLFDDEFEVRNVVRGDNCQSTIMEWQQVRHDYMNEAKQFFCGQTL